MLALPTVSGCATVDLWGGYYLPSAKDPKTPVANQAEMSVDASWGIGIGTTVFYDHDQKLRIGASASANYIPIKAENAPDKSFTDGSIGLSGHYALTGEETKLLAALALGYGGGTALGTEVKVISGWAGVAAGFYGGSGSYNALLLGLGVRYINASQSDDTAGHRGVGMWGPEFRIGVPVAYLFGGGGGGSGGGGSDLNGWTVDIGSDKNMIPALAQGLRRKGCTVKEESNAVFGGCEAGAIGYVQKGSQVLIACTDDLSESQCRQLNSDVIEAAKR
ncbi:MAG: hypothetical protein OZ921_03005 [Sorangiineae bacterium]|nr:hypothetical protein [Sorangiineae bacterium]